MVKINLITNGGRKTVIASETKTLREIYEENDVNYDSCTNTIDSVPLRVGDLNKSLRELGVGETCRMSSIVKMDNAAKIILTGGACIIKSGVKLDDWKKVLKFEPEFGLYTEDNEPIFLVDVDEGVGSLNSNGAVFSNYPEHDGYAVITTVVDPAIEDKVQVVADKLGTALLRLNELEAKVPEKIEAADNKEKEIREAITLM
jgi:hypothetical protein